MLEMIVVIALIMLLLIGGLYGAEKVYVKVQVKFVTERLIALKNQRKINAAQKQGTNEQIEQGPFGAELVVENGEVGTENQDYFWIIVKKLNAYFCNEIAKADVGAVKVDTDHCPNESIFYFSKFSDGTGGGSSTNPDAGRDPSETCEAGWSATRPSCRANQKLVSESGCYQCQDLATCESPWESYVSCGWGQEEKSLRLADEMTTCYQCVDSTSCPSGWSQADSVSCGVGETKTIKPLTNGTQCAQCETLATCNDTYPETVSCAANQKEEVAFRATDGKICKKCTYLTSCSDKTGYSTTPCVQDKIVDSSFTLQGTSTTCYKCKEITACSDQTGYQEAACRNNQTEADSFNWNGKTCRKCEDISCPDGGSVSNGGVCCKNYKAWNESTTQYDSRNPGECGCPDGGSENDGGCCKEGYYLNESTGAYDIPRSYTCGGCPSGTTVGSDGFSCCKDGLWLRYKNDSVLNIGYCGCPEQGTSVQSIYCCKNGLKYDSNDKEYKLLDYNICGCPDNGNYRGSEETGYGCCKDGFMYSLASHQYDYVEFNICGCPSGSSNTGTGESIDGSVCKCLADAPHWNGTQCESICSGDTPYWDGTQCTDCPDETPLWTGSQCQACPTSSSRVIVAESGDCENLCTGAVETPNSDGTYSCCPSNYPHWNGTQCVACSGSTPLWTGTACVACPTNGGSVVLTTSGVCASACNGAETDNGNGTYTCADASMMCQTAMENAGFKQCDATTTSQCFTVSGNNVTWVHGTSIMSLSSSKELIMPACNLTVNTRAQIYGNMTVRDLTITNSSSGNGLETSSSSKNTITVGGDLTATAPQYAISLASGVTLTVAGDVTATSTNTSAVSTTTGSTFNVSGIFEPNGMFKGANLCGNADFAQRVEAESGGNSAALYLEPSASDVITFHGNVKATSTNAVTALSIRSNANITFHGDVTAEATSSGDASGNGAFEINSNNFYGSKHTVTINGVLKGIANGKFNGIVVGGEGNLVVTGDIVGICKGTKNGIRVSGEIQSTGGRIVGKTNGQYGIYMLCPATLSAARGIYYNGTGGIYTATGGTCTISGTKYNSIPASYDSL